VWAFFALTWDFALRRVTIFFILSFLFFSVVFGPLSSLPPHFGFFFWREIYLSEIRVPQFHLCFFFALSELL